MSELYFVFKGISSVDMPMMVNELPPITKAAADINKIVIPGRDGFLTEDMGTHSGTVKPVECTLLDLSRVDEVSAWLEGSGDVIFSNQPDRRYKATIINQIPFSRIFKDKWYSFIIILECQPLAAMLNNEAIALLVPGIIYNSGTHKSKPVITIYGAGTIDLTVNSAVIHLTNVVEYVTIDSDLMDCYKDTILKNNNMLGEFPKLDVGENVISWTGTVTKVEILPNWCCL